MKVINCIRYENLHGNMKKNTKTSKCIEIRKLKLSMTMLAVFVKENDGPC